MHCWCGKVGSIHVFVSIEYVYYFQISGLQTKCVNISPHVFLVNSILCPTLELCARLS